MSIVALKKKYLESKNISHNKQFSLNSRQSLKYCTFNMGSFLQTSVKSSTYIHNRKKQWKSLKINSLPENFNGDPSAFKYICNNWVQTTGADENYIENKALTAICDNSNNAVIKSNYCNISKNISSEPLHISKKIKTLECSKIGFNKAFPYNVTASKPSFISCKDRSVDQIYNAHKYYGFSENYYAGTIIVDSLYRGDPNILRYIVTLSQVDNNPVFLFTGEGLINAVNPEISINIYNTLYLTFKIDDSNHNLIISDETGPYDSVSSYNERLIFVPSSSNQYNYFSNGSPSSTTGVIIVND